VTGAAPIAEVLVSGVVEGGWEFVAGAYIVTAAILSAYATSVLPPLPDRAAPRGRRGGTGGAEMSEVGTPSPDRRLSPTRTKWFALAALGVATAAFLFIAIGGIGENLVYYWGPKELLAAGSKATGASIRLGGQVAVGSVKRGDGVSNLEFDVTDGTAPFTWFPEACLPALPRSHRGGGRGHDEEGWQLREPPTDGLARQQVPRSRRQERRHPELMRSTEGLDDAPAPRAAVAGSPP